MRQTQTQKSNRLPIADASADSSTLGTASTAQQLYQSCKDKGILRQTGCLISGLAALVTIGFFASPAEAFEGT